MKIWGENWIPNVQHSVSSTRFGSNEQGLSIDCWEKKWWDNDKFVNEFSEEKVAAVKTILISHIDQLDLAMYEFGAFLS